MRGPGALGVLGLALTLGCADRDLVKCNQAKVTPAEYFDEETCWESSREDFSAIMILIETPGGKVPYMLSQNCQLLGEFAQEELDLYAYRSPIAVYAAEAEHLFGSAHFGGDVVLNTRSHAPMPTSTDKAYAVDIRVQKDSNRDSGLVLSEVLDSRPIDLNFHEILEVRRTCKTN